METKFKAISKDSLEWVSFQSFSKYQSPDFSVTTDDNRDVKCYSISLCQFSGCLDCRGNKIYKGDFLKVVEGVSVPYIFGSVRFEKGVFYISDGENNEEPKRPLHEMIDNFGYKFEVVGNEWNIIKQKRSKSAILNEKAFYKWVSDTKADVLQKPVNGEKFSVGETVIYTNDYGSKFKCKILGFRAEPDVVGNEYRTVYLDTSQPRLDYPYDVKHISKIF